MIRLLITEDSPSVAEILKSIFKADPEIEVVGWACNGRESIQLTAELKPDVIIMDITMPVMDGLEATRVIMSTIPTPILILSSLIKDDDPHSGFDALRAGALDIMEKPVLRLNHGDLTYTTELIRKIKIVAKVKPIHLIRSGKKDTQVTQKITTPEDNRILAMGASTGGPPAICNILKNFVPGFPLPILIVQHIFSGFIQGMVNWLSKDCSIRVKIAEHGELLAKGVAYFPPDDTHLGIDKTNRIVLCKDPPLRGHRPSVDFMMQQVAGAYRDQSIGVLLTGMGRDGTEGLKAIKEQGGKTIAQDERTSVIFGMPKSAIDVGVVDMVCPLERIASEIINLLSFH